MLLFFLQAADAEVMEAYKKISSARSKKKPPTSKEREQAWKALKEREIILKNLEIIWDLYNLLYAVQRYVSCFGTNLRC